MLVYQRVLPNGKCHGQVIWDGHGVFVRHPIVGIPSRLDVGMMTITLAMPPRKLDNCTKMHK